MNSKDQHPLLSEDLLRIKAPIQREGLQTNGDSAHDGQSVDVVDSFGSLKISDTGLTNYYGQATSSWVSHRLFAVTSDACLLTLPLPMSQVLPSGKSLQISVYVPPFDDISSLPQNEGSREADRDDRLSNLRRVLPPEVLALAGFFPIAPNIPPTVDAEEEKMERVRGLYWYLPPSDEAEELRHIYYTHAAWMYVSDILSHM